MDEFLETLWTYYAKHRRELPWRDTPYEPYRILVSEFMLQQTQAARVAPKYESFIMRFPTLSTLAEAELGDVLREWSGLGYNRRAKYLHEAAKQLASLEGRWSMSDLISVKGIGENTAAAILVYAYDEPHVFVETNVRTVYIHHFFPDHEAVGDKEIISLLERSIDTEHPRDFYYALMDYGTFLKKTAGNAGRRSRHYTKQSPFLGSVRYLRGQVIKELAHAPATEAELYLRVADERLSSVLKNLVDEGLIQKTGSTHYL